MSTPLTLIHTAEVHRATFDALRDRIAPDQSLVHIVEPDWLSRAMKHGVRQNLIDELAHAIRAAPGPVLCTCTTLGEAAGELGATRIDAPMMEKAAQIGGRILMVFALESTREVSTNLLVQALENAREPSTVVPLYIGQFWPLFEAGEIDAFVACTAGAIRDAVEHDSFDCVVIAQASMAAAAPMLTDLDVPVLASPEIALRSALQIDG